MSRNKKKAVTLPLAAPTQAGPTLGQRAVGGQLPSVSRRTAAVGLVVAGLSLLVSATPMWVSARTFYVAQRPYVGIVEHSFTPLGDPPSGMAWQFVLSNAGDRPAWVTVEEHRSTVIIGGKEVDLPLIGAPRGGIMLMPGQKAPLTGQFLDANGTVKVADVLTGAVQLRSSIRVSYSAESPFFGRRDFFYRATSEFRHNTVPQAFVMTEGDGN